MSIHQNHVYSTCVLMNNDREAVCRADAVFGHLLKMSITFYVKTQPCLSLRVANEMPACIHLNTAGINQMSYSREQSCCLICMCGGAGAAALIMPHLPRTQRPPLCVM